jgi:hypothetical protein
MKMTVCRIGFKHGEGKVLTAYKEGKGQTPKKDVIERMKLVYHHGEGRLTSTDGVSLIEMTIPADNSIFDVEFCNPITSTMPVGLYKITDSYMKDKTHIVELTEIENYRESMLHTCHITDILKAFTTSVPLLYKAEWNKADQVLSAITTTRLYTILQHVKSINENTILSYNIKYLEIMKNLKCAEHCIDTIYTYTMEDTFYKNMNYPIKFERESLSGVKVSMILMPIRNVIATEYL